MNQEVLQIPSARLCLSAMTLRGIGPYGTGARLELRPLTILCGANGGGKSTWIKALKTLTEVVKNPWFPVKLSNSGSFFYQGTRDSNESLPNGVAAQGESIDEAPLDGRAIDEAFGTFGTVGLELKVVDDFVLELNSTSRAFLDSPSKTFGEFFWRGKLSKEDEILVRLGDAFNLNWSDAPVGSSFELSSLWLNG
ncbi:MAG: hypothetical protein ABL962_18980, partial [Fimbriimonadaceae bacterium]